MTFALTPPESKYPPGFSKTWKAWLSVGGRGTKHDAHKAWNAFACEKHCEAIFAAIYAYARRDSSWRAGYIPHFSTWIRRRSWETLPPEPTRDTVVPAIEETAEYLRREREYAAKVAATWAEGRK